MYYWKSEKAIIESIERLDDVETFSTRRMIIHVRLVSDNSLHMVNWCSAPSVITQNLHLTDKAAPLFPLFWDEERNGKVGQLVYYRHTADLTHGYLVPIE